MTRRFSALTITVALAALVATTAPARAASDEDIATARGLALEGVKLSEDGNCAAAIDKFQKAESIYHTPSVLERLGECQITLGKLVAGTETLNKVVREQLPANAPAPFVNAQAKAKELLDKTLPRIGKLKVHVDAPDGAQLTFKIDGVQVSTATLDADRASDPGKHVVEISGAGLTTVRGEVTVAEGASATLSLKIESATKVKPKPVDDGDEPDREPKTKPKPKPVDDDGDDGDDADDAPRKKPTPKPALPPEPSGPSRVLPITLFATAGVGLAVGTIFGLRASGKKSDLDAVCVNGGCPSAYATDVDAMKNSATISTVGFGVGIAAAAVGTFLWFSASPEQPKPGAAYVQPMIGLGFVGVRGAL